MWLAWQEEQHRTTHYLAGTCLQQADAEPWDEIVRVEQVGKHSYLVRKTPDSLYRASKGWAIPKETDMVEVECPTKGGK